MKKSLILLLALLMLSGCGNSAGYATPKHRLVCAEFQSDR